MESEPRREQTLWRAVGTRTSLSEPRDKESYPNAEAETPAPEGEEAPAPEVEADDVEAVFAL